VRHAIGGADLGQLRQAVEREFVTLDDQEKSVRTVVAQLESGRCQGSKPCLSIGSTVAAQAVNFLILVWLLKRFHYKPVLAAIDEREKRIATQLQDAEKKKAEALEEQTDFLHKNDEFERQRSGLLLDA